MHAWSSKIITNVTHSFLEVAGGTTLRFYFYYFCSILYWHAWFSESVQHVVRLRMAPQVQSATFMLQVNRRGRRPCMKKDCEVQNPSTFLWLMEGKAGRKLCELCLFGLVSLLLQKGLTEILTNSMSWGALHCQTCWFRVDLNAISAFCSVLHVWFFIPWYILPHSLSQADVVFFSRESATTRTTYLHENRNQ